MKLNEYLDKLRKVPKNVALYLEFPDGKVIPYSKTDIEIRDFEEVLKRGTMSYEYNRCFYHPTRYEVVDISFNKEKNVNIIKLI